MKASEDIRKIAIEATKMDTKQFLKSELNKIDKNAFWEIDGYGNTDIIVRVMEKYAQAKTIELEFALDYQKGRDLDFLKGIKEAFGKAREDKTLLEFAEEMVDDWICELEECLNPQPHFDNGTVINATKQENSHA